MKATAKKNGKPAPAATQFRVVGKDEPESGVRKLNLGALVKPAAKKATTHPQINASKETLALLEQFLEIEPKFKALEKQSKSLKQQIAPLIKGDVFSYFKGIALDVTQVVVAGLAGLRLTVKESYTRTVSDDRALITALAMNGMSMSEAAAFVGRYFCQATKIEIDLDKVAEEKQSVFAEGVIALAEKLGITEGLTAKQYIAPRAGFHAARTTLLTVEQNQAIDTALPVSAFPVLER
jgi:hypothetical protein